MDKKIFILRILEIRLYSIKSLCKLTKSNINFLEWKNKTEHLLKILYGDSALSQKFSDIKYSPSKNLYYNYSLSKEEQKESYLEGLKEAESILKETIEKYRILCTLEHIPPLELNITLNESAAFNILIDSLNIGNFEKINLQNDFLKICSSQSSYEDNESEGKFLDNQIVKYLNKFDLSTNALGNLTSIVEILEIFKK